MIVSSPSLPPKYWVGDKLRPKPHTAARIDQLGRRLCSMCVQLVFIDLPQRAFRANGRV